MDFHNKKIAVDKNDTNKKIALENIDIYTLSSHDFYELICKKNNNDEKIKSSHSKAKKNKQPHSLNGACSIALCVSRFMKTILIKQNKNWINWILKKKVDKICHTILQKQINNNNNNGYRFLSQVRKSSPPPNQKSKIDPFVCTTTKQMLFLGCFQFN